MLYSYPTAVLVGLAGLFAWLVVARVRAYRRLSHIPGPFGTGWTDLWLIRAQISGRISFILADANTKYGPLVRIAPNWVVLGDPFEVRKLWAVRGPWHRGDWYRGLRLDPYRDSTFTALDDKVHDSLRSKLVPGYNGKDVDNLHELIDQQVMGFVNLLEIKYLSTPASYKPVDLARKVQYFTLDVISALAFGKKLGYLEADRDAFHYIETTEKTIPFLMTTALMPWVLNIIQSPKLRWLIPDARNMVGIGTVMQLAEQAVQSRYGSKPDVKRDMLGSFVAHGLSKQDAEGESVVQIIAGSDTSATAIRSTMLFIMTNPHVYARFQAEIDARVAAGLISSPITDAEAKQFPYLQAVIREGIRMWPPATGLLPKVSKTDQFICGQRIPAGTNVAWAPFSVMRNKTVFGDDAGIFRPERWIDVPQDKWRLMDSTVMLDFGSPSRWECLGKNIAMIELNKTYVELLRRFDFTLIDPTDPWTSFNAAFFIQKDLMVRITPRANPS
ncbi:cytochrome P450 86A1 [Coniochaeta sp. 2T2.1]|nr:cytochrome P450 86A1 [Coniochaeta sp. 2T2.1]